MEEVVSLNQVYDALLSLQKEVEFIKSHMVDVDSFLTAEEKNELDESLKEFEQGKAFSLEDIKKDREDA